MRAQSFREQSTALTLIEVLVCLTAIILLASVLLPALTGNQRKPSTIRCMNNLKQIGLAIHMWTEEHENKLPWQVSNANGGSAESIAAGQASPHLQCLATYMRESKIFICPSDKTKKASSNHAELNECNVSYFINVDGVTSNVGPCLVAGDRHLQTNGQRVGPGLLAVRTNSMLGWTRELHGKGGPVGVLLFNDWHVDRCSTSNWLTVVQRHVALINRFAIP